MKNKHWTLSFTKNELGAVRISWGILRDKKWSFEIDAKRAFDREFCESFFVARQPRVNFCRETLIYLNRPTGMCHALRSFLDCHLTRVFDLMLVALALPHF